ncbi:TetR/AcrR family transcriptional regulator [Nocardiopsis halotolerans]|uniref:TetR/AcrR family transcriptional regulator n=1 Tax=Nocardiopsis halotolerans TaxID=124252 RepID=UPI00036662AF|nr:TetR/AcrR family transcriptional regulator [Nocardiopsis halotolerans]
MNPTRRRDRAATRAALLDAARLRFSRHGYDGTGVREIAADAGVDPALVFRYFGSKKELYARAVRPEVPEGLADDTGRSAAELADTLLHEVVLADWEEYGGEHPLLAMLRSSGHADVREQLRAQVCDGYLRTFAERLPEGAPELRAEMLGALLLGLGVMRSVVGSPALTAAPSEETRALFARMVAPLVEEG